MGYKCAFMDNGVYSADDVNGIISRLTTEGVVLIDSGNVLSDLNTVTSEITSEGVQNYPDSCKLICTDGVYKIGEGVCFMADGSAIIFDSDGYEITPVSDTYCYVYIKRNTPYNTIDVVVSDAEGEGDFVPIAEIDEYGVVYDRRTFSMARVKLNTENSLKSYSCSLDIGNGQSTTIDLGTSNFTKIILNYAYRIMSNVPYGPIIPAYHNMKEIADGEAVEFKLGANEGNQGTESVSFTKNGQNLQITTSDSNRYYQWEYYFDVI